MEKTVAEYGASRHVTTGIGGNTLVPFEVCSPRRVRRLVGVADVRVSVSGPTSYLHSWPSPQAAFAVNLKGTM